MKNGTNFHRVLDNNGKLIGVLDLNNMIPVRKDVLWVRKRFKVYERSWSGVKYWEDPDYHRWIMLLYLMSEMML